MYKLTVEFKNNQELAAFVIKLGGLPAQAAVTQTMPVSIEQAPAPQPEVVVEEKPKKAKAKKETIVDQGEEIEVPPVIEKPAPKAIDRDGIIKTVTSAIQDLTAAGMKGPNLAKHLGDLYIQTDCPAGTKIGQLDDEALSRFFPAFMAFVAETKGQQIVQPEQASFV